MDLLVLNDEMAAFEAAPAPLAGGARLEALVPLAWHLRQRDSQRALDLCAEAHTLLRQSAPDGERCQAISARLWLAEAEARWLLVDQSAGMELALQALDSMQARGDRLGQADARLLLAMLARERGDSHERDRQLELARAAAHAGGDAMRETVCAAISAFSMSFTDPDAVAARWGGHFGDAPEGLHPGAASCVHDFLGMQATYTNRFGLALRHFIRAHETALQTGQVRRAIVCAINVGDNLNTLNDHHAALEWMQRGVALARTMRWPASIATTLMQAAESLRHLGRLQAAQDLLDESLALLHTKGASRSFSIALEYSGNLALDRGHHEEALEIFQKFEFQSETSNLAEFQTSARRGQAHALLRLGRPAEALECAAEALAIAKGKGKGNANNQIAALKVLAEIHALHDLPATEDCGTLSPALHYLQRALDIGASIEGYTVNADLFNAIADGHAAAGDFARAFEFSRRANAASEKSNSEEATNRVIASEVRHQIERTQAESEHHRQLALAEARRAEVLEQTGTTLMRLGAVGQEITTHLDPHAVFLALNNHLHGLLPVTCLVIYLLEPDGANLRLAYGFEGGQELEKHLIPVSNPHANSARAVRERREIVVHREPDDSYPNIIPGTAPTLSMLFSPLTIGERILGVMSVQSLQANAYRETEQLIFRTLSAYGAIALSNAESMAALRQAQAQLVQQEKLASLGGLVAGVAHEVNTPLGVALTALSGADSTLKQLSDAIGAGQLSRLLLHTSIEESLEYTGLALFNARRAAALVASFKAIAVQRPGEQAQDLDLGSYLPDIAALVHTELERNGHRIEVEADVGLHARIVPEALTEALARVLTNVLDHAFDGAKGGCARLRARRCEGGQLEIEVADDGHGIAPEALPKVFDPFFTTRCGIGGHVGLGLHVAYNHVTQRLNGTIRITSTPGQGTCVTIRLPTGAQDGPGAKQ